MGIFWITNIILILIEAGILLAIIVMYAKTIFKIRSRAFIPILTFSTLFLIQSVLSVYFYYDFSHFVGPDVAVPLIAVNSVGLASFLLLLFSLRQ